MKRSDDEDTIFTKRKGRGSRKATRSQGVHGAEPGTGQTKQQLHLSVPGPPVAQPRHRISTRGGFAQTYLPSDHPVHVYKKAIALQAVGYVVFAGAVEVRIVAWFPMPTSWSKKKRREHDFRWHTQKPDADNVGKAVLDALSEHWTDDCQVAILTVQKRWYSGTGLTQVSVREIQEGE
ncbi:MAG UNVERIFIED_CONTAM: RusA family crossover junction endodeoxyribonuclease [Planctomycetaceae bacterium]